MGWPLEPMQILCGTISTKCGTNEGKNSVPSVAARLSELHATAHRIQASATKYQEVVNMTALNIGFRCPNAA